MTWSWYPAGGERLQRDWLVDGLDSYGPNLYQVTRPYNVKGCKLWRSEDGGQTWSTVLIRTSEFASFNDLLGFSLRIDSGGTAHLGVAARIGLNWYPHYCTYDLTTDQWSGPEQIGTANSGDGERYVMVNLGSSEQPIIKMSGLYDSFFYARRASGGWTDMSWGGGVQSTTSGSRVVHLSTGLPVTLQDGRTSIPTGPIRLYRFISGSWLSIDVDTGGAYNIAAQVDQTGSVVHFAYKQAKILYHRSYDGSTLSSRHQIVDCSTISGGITRVDVCDLSVDSSGVLRVLYRPTPYPGSYQGSLFESLSSDGGLTWGSPQGVYITDGLWFAHEASRYYPHPQAGAAILAVFRNPSWQPYPWFGRSSDFRFVTTYGPWRTWVVSGDDLELVVM